MSRKKLAALKEQANGLDDSPSKVAILEEAIRIADSLGDIPEGLKLRDQLILCAYGAGQEEKAFVAFAWTVAHKGDVQDFMEEFMLLFQYKMLLGVAPDFPSLALTTIRKMQEDFKRRLTTGAYPLRAYFRVMSTNARDLGLLDEQARFAKLWKESPADSMFACDSCECWYYVDDSLSNGNRAAATSKARPIFSGKLTSCNVPTRTYAIFLQNSLVRGDLKGAKKFFDLGFPLAAGDEDCLWSIRYYLAYLIRTGDIARGLRVIERHLPMVTRRTNSWTRMKYFSLAADFFERTDEIRPRTRKVRLPEALSIHEKTGRYSPNDLKIWFRNEATQLAQAFDKRNGNDYVSWELGRDRALGLGLPTPKYPESRDSIDDKTVKKGVQTKPSRALRKKKAGKLP